MLQLRLLGEDLVLFRTKLGEGGLVGNRCLHRGLSRGYGIPQVNGLRCAYHGWTYGVNGARATPSCSSILAQGGDNTSFQFRVPVDDAHDHLLVHGEAPSS